MIITAIKSLSIRRCKADEVDFRDWLVHVLENIHAYNKDYSKDLEELLPHNWKSKNYEQL